MNAHHAYYSEMLSLYTDGQLNETEQQVLFAELANNSALREELQHTLLIRNTVRAEKNTVPITLRASVLSAVGVPAVVDSVTGVVSATRYSTRFGSQVLSFALGALVMMGLNSFIWSGNTETSQQSIVQTSNNTTIEQLPKLNGKSSLTTQQQGAIGSNHTSKPRAVPTVNYVQHNDAQSPEQPIIQPDNNSQNNIGSTNDAIHSVLSSAAPSVLHSVDEPLIERSKEMHQSEIPSGSSVPMSAQVSRAQSSLPFSLEVRGFAARSFPQFDLPGLINPPVNNFAASVHWITSDNLSVGIEAGQETILQEYEVNNGANGRTIIRQNHLGLWGGVQTQYILYKQTQESLFAISPAIRGTIGATRMGPMARISGGALIGINNRADLALFIESSFFGYQQGGVWNSTTKLGTSLGLCIYF